MLEKDDALKMRDDSDIIFTATSTGSFENYKQAKEAIVLLYVPDMRFSRAGISHALKRLEKHFNDIEKKKEETKKAMIASQISDLEKKVGVIKNKICESYEVDRWNNFCRVFMLPEKFSSNFCFGGGIPTNFQMVDWFNPVANIGSPGISKKEWLENFKNLDGMQTTITLKELKDNLLPHLQVKTYVRTDRQYLVICDFGATFMFERNE